VIVLDITIRLDQGSVCCAVATGDVLVRSYKKSIKWMMTMMMTRLAGQPRVPFRLGLSMSEAICRVVEIVTYAERPKLLGYADTSTNRIEIARTVG